MTDNDYPTILWTGDSYYVWTHCPECGPDVVVDDDGCCVTCGADAIHYGERAEPATDPRRYVLLATPTLRARREALERELAVLLDRCDAIEAKRDELWGEIKRREAVDDD